MNPCIGGTNKYVTIKGLSRLAAQDSMDFLRELVLTIVQMCAFNHCKDVIQPTSLQIVFQNLRISFLNLWPTFLIDSTFIACCNIKPVFPYFIILNSGIFGLQNLWQPKVHCRFGEPSMHFTTNYSLDLCTSVCIVILDASVKPCRESVN